MQNRARPVRSVTVREMFHTMTCNVIVEPRLSDRFYMDMRVYRVLPHPLANEDSKGSPLVWRGIYVALQMGPAQQPGRTARG